MQTTLKCMFVLLSIRAVPSLGYSHALSVLSISHFDRQRSSGCSNFLYEQHPESGKTNLTEQAVLSGLRLGQESDRVKKGLVCGLSVDTDMIEFAL